VKNLGATYKESLVLYEISINLHLPSFSEPWLAKYKRLVQARMYYWVAIQTQTRTSNR
jgi:hypothetical protein